MIVDGNQILMALSGGVLIGLAVTLMLALNGRVTGISGITYRSFADFSRDGLWRLSFLVGLLFGGALLVELSPSVIFNSLEYPTWRTALAGLFVGFGTLLGGGCTSGHGVCGMSRLSIRSIVATLTFISAGALTVFFIGA